MADVKVPRPAKGFTSARAQKWVLTVAIVDGLIYLVRHLIEGDTSPAPATNAARQFLGQGSPPSFSQWIVAYSASFLGLALLAAAAPELAGSLAIFVLAATFLESGGQFATDLGQLGAGGPKLSGVGATSANIASLTAPLTNLAGDPFGLAPSPQSVGAGVAAAPTRAQQQSEATALRNKIDSEINTPAWRARNGPGQWTVGTVNGQSQILHDGVVWNG